MINNPSLGIISSISSFTNSCRLESFAYQHTQSLGISRETVCNEINDYLCLKDLSLWFYVKQKEINVAECSPQDVHSLDNYLNFNLWYKTPLGVVSRKVQNLQNLLTSKLRALWVLMFVPQSTPHSALATGPQRCRYECGSRLPGDVLKWFLFISENLPKMNFR